MPNIYLIIFLFSKDCINISNNKISINKDNKNIFIHFQLYFYPLMFYRMGRYCLPDSCFLLVCDPETQSRGTLTLLGTGFQPDLLFGCLVVQLFGCLVVQLFGCLVVWLFSCLVVWGAFFDQTTGILRPGRRTITTLRCSDKVNKN